MTLKVWLRTTWVDKRLSWDPKDYGNIEFLPSFAKSISAPEETAIWVPDIKMYNSGDSLLSTLDPAAPMIHSDGSIFWSRPGRLDVLCKFSGLVAFPFDRLTCAVDFGGWSLSGRYQGIELLNGGYELHDANDESSAGNTYQEYAINNVTVTVSNKTYPCCPDEPWPLVTYWVSLDRASFYYYNAIIVPGSVFAYLSFFAFFMSYKVGERLGFCITLILATEVSKVVVSSMVPVCGELLWVEIFNMLNFAFTVVSLSISVLTLWFAYRTDDVNLSCVPDWLVSLTRLAMQAWKGTQKSSPPLSVQTDGAISSDDLSSSPLAEPGEGDSFAGVIYREIAQAMDPELLTPQSGNAMRIRADTASPGFGDRKSIHQPVDDLNSSTSDIKARLWRDKHGKLRATGKMRQEDTEALSERLVFFEQLFFMIDLDAKGWISLEDAQQFLSFTALNLTLKDAKNKVKAADTEQDEKLVRYEFIEMCIDLLWDVSMDQLDVAVKNYKECQAMYERRNTIKWRALASRIDSFARIWVPLLYTALLIAIFHMDMQDEYLAQSSRSSFEGWGTWTVRNYNLLVLPSLVFLVLLAWCTAREVARQKQLPGLRRFKLTDRVSRLIKRGHAPDVSVDVSSQHEERTLDDGMRSAEPEAKEAV